MQAKNMNAKSGKRKFIHTLQIRNNYSNHLHLLTGSDFEEKTLSASLPNCKPDGLSSDDDKESEENERSLISLAEALNCAEEALNCIEEATYNCVYLLNSEQRSGYLRHVLEEAFSSQHDAVLLQLLQQVQEPDLLKHEQKIIGQFELGCASLREKLIEEYGIDKLKALERAVDVGAESIEAILLELEVEVLWGLTALKDREDLLQSCLQGFISDIKGNVLEFVSGWLVHRRAPFNGIIDLTDSNVDPETVGELQLESRFLTSLQERLQAKVGTFKTHWMQMLAPCLKALTAAEEALYNCVYLLNAEHHSGYLKHVLREKISDQHDAILKQLHQQSQVVLPSVLAQFELDCNFLLVEQYGIAKQRHCTMQSWAVLKI